MTKSYFTVVLGLVSVAVLIGVVYLFAKESNTNNYTNNTDPKNASYVIDGQEVTLKNGKSEVEAAPNSASKIITKYFGNEVKSDFNADGREDTAFILTQSTGGSGTFFYLVVALNTENGYVGSEGYLLGDRIAPQSTELGEGNIIVVNYVDRKLGESFDTKPSVGKTTWLLLDPHTMQFGVVEPNFEGEADPESMSLDMKSWSWQSIKIADGAVVPTKNPDKFVLTFNDDNTFTATTDCNGLGGKYSAEDKNIQFTEIVSTLMFCEDSEEQIFTTALNEVGSYNFNGKGELILYPKSGNGSMVFK